MPTRLFAAVLLFGMTLVASAPAQEPATTNVPHIACDESTYDFGTVDPSQTVEHTFVIRNTGTLTLEITRVQPSCGCTVANISEKSVPPGGESHITSRLSLQGRSGPQHKTIVVDSNDPLQPQTILTIKGEVGAAVSVQPAQITMPRVPTGSQPSTDVLVTGGDGTPFKVTAVESTSDDLAAVVESLEEGKSYRVNIALKKPLTGAFNATVVVRTDHPRRPTIEIPVNFIAAREVVVAPREINFDKPGDSAVSRFVLVRNADGTPVELDGVDAPNSSVQVNTEPFGSNGIRIQMSNLVPNRDINGRVLRIHPRGADVIEIPIHVQGLDG